jgi:hypothetical protein
MPSRWSFILIGALILASFGGVGFLIFRNMTGKFVCNQKDVRICKLLENTQKNDLTKGQGTYIKTDADEHETQFQWKLQNDETEIIVKTNKKKILHVIADGELLYIQNPDDSTWLKQRLSDKSEVEKNLPFQIKKYYKEFATKLANQALTFSYIDAEPCQKETCYRYLIKSNESENIQQYLYVTGAGELKAYRFAAAEDKEQFNIDKFTAQIELPTQAKSIDPHKNMILEIMTKATENTSKLDYVQEFEKQRRATEGDTPTPIPTAILTPIK